MRSMITILLITLLVACMPKEQTSQEIYTFSQTSNKEWTVVNDGVMGGLSQGDFQVTSEGYGKFFGHVSVANNGGFTMIQLDIGHMEVGDYTQIKIRLKGDGKSYQFRLRANAKDYYTYIYNFSTTGDWQTLIIDLAKMAPYYRGDHLDKANFDQTAFSEIAFLIGNKVAENFELVVQDVQFN